MTSARRPCVTSLLAPACGCWHRSHHMGMGTGKSRKWTALEWHSHSFPMWKSGDHILVASFIFLSQNFGSCFCSVLPWNSSEELTVFFEWSDIFLAPLVEMYGSGSESKWEPGIDNADSYSDSRKMKIRDFDMVLEVIRGIPIRVRFWISVELESARVHANQNTLFLRSK